VGGDKKGGGSRWEKKERGRGKRKNGHPRGVSSIVVIMIVAEEKKWGGGGEKKGKGGNHHDGVFFDYSDDHELFRLRRLF